MRPNVRRPFSKRYTGFSFKVCGLKKSKPSEANMFGSR
jgi:hypothetical protein